MSKLSDHPIKFNTTEMYFPGNFTISRGVIETVNQSEAGTDIVQIARRGKITVSVDTNCTADWLTTYRTFFGLNSFTLYVWDAGANDYETHIVRMRNLKEKLIKKSWDLDGQSGLWNVSFTLEEF